MSNEPIKEKPYNDIEGCIRIGQIVKTLMTAFGSDKFVIRLVIDDAAKQLKELHERIK